MTQTTKKKSQYETPDMCELLYQLLLNDYSVKQLRSKAKVNYLQFPEFFIRGNQPEEGRVYLARSRDLPLRCPVSCCFICIGTEPDYIYNGWTGAILFVDEPGLDLMTLFNTVINHMQRLVDWDRELMRLVQRKADVEEFVKVSIPVFENCITISDYNLRILVSCDVTVQNGKRRVVIDKTFSRVPDVVSAEFMDIASDMTKHREPYSYCGQRENPEGMNYCINLFIRNSYVGCCVLWDKMRPMHESDHMLFRYFAGIIQKVMSIQEYRSTNQLVTMKRIFSDLLQCYPVSIEEYTRAQELMNNSLQQDKLTFENWYCFTLQSANHDKQLPAEYICSAIEEMLPHTIAMPLDGNIVGFYLQSVGTDYMDVLGDILPPYLKDMNFHVGVSKPFNDIFKTYENYQLANAILQEGLRHAPEEVFHTFDEMMVYYLLDHARGEFSTGLVCSAGLDKLRALSSSVDYIDTLRHYLDNECNASQTAQELYLHRSSLLPRLERIRTLVPLDTPQQRLYLRLCLSMMELSEH